MSFRKTPLNLQQPSNDSHPDGIASLAKYIGRAVEQRISCVLWRVKYLLLMVVWSIPTAWAHIKDPPSMTLVTSKATDPTSTAVSKESTVQEDINRESNFSLDDWAERGQNIRSRGGSNATEKCLRNLSVALKGLGSLNAAEYSGSAAALSLLPTAGALIGAPTKELWVVYKLMPLAGILSMCLSLGGTIVPPDAGAYDPKVLFTYGGLIATDHCSLGRGAQRKFEHVEMATDEAAIFAARVEDRSIDDRGGDYSKVWVGIGIQMILVGTIFVALWVGQTGGVIPWWCNVSLD